MGLIRRLISAFEGKDLPVPAFAARIGKDKKQVYRYERGEVKPPEEVVDLIVELSTAAGLQVTAEWIERGRGGLAALGDLRVPESALVVRPPTEEEEEPVPTAVVAIPRSHEEQRAAAKKKTAPTRRARGG